MSQKTQSKFDTEWTTFPTCPACGMIDQDWWDGLESKWDGDVWDWECQQCGADVVISMSVSTNFDTELKHGKNKKNLG